MSQEKPMRLLRAKDVLIRIGLSRAHLYNLIAEGDFPQSIELVPGGRSRAWVESEIDEWIRQRIHASREAS